MGLGGKEGLRGEAVSTARCVGPERQKASFRRKEAGRTMMGRQGGYI